MESLTNLIALILSPKVVAGIILLTTSFFFVALAILISIALVGIK